MFHTSRFYTLFFFFFTNDSNPLYFLRGFQIVDHKACIENWTEQQVPETLLTDKDMESHVKTPKQVSLQQELDQLNIQLNNLFLKDRERERQIQAVPLHMLVNNICIH